MDEATIEALAFGVRPSREVDRAGRSRYLSTREENKRYNQKLWIQIKGKRIL